MKFNSNQSFTERFKTLGDPAEQAFEAFAAKINTRFERYGWNRPSFKNFRNMPETLRFQPDYLWERDKRYLFVECKGTGGRILKLKEASHFNLGFWHERLTHVEYFLWDSNKSRFVLIPYTTMNEITLTAPVKYFSNDNNSYYEIACSRFEWEDLKENAT